MKFNLWEDCDKVPLTELLSFVVDNRGKTVPTVPSGHKLIATNCVTNNTLFPVYEKIRYLSEETYQTWFRAHPIPGDILFVNKGTPGRVCLVPDPVDFCIAQDMIALRADESKIYPKYLFAVLRSREIQQQIYNTNVGDVIPHFKKQFLDQLMIPIPERSIQESIGDLYYVLSLKAERNKMINDNLEQQTMALYRQMFVETSNDTRRVCRVDECFDISIGKTPPRKEAQWFSMNPTDCIWVSISDMGRCGMYIADSSEYLTHESVEKFNIKVVPDNTVLLSFKLTVGRVAITDGAMATNEAIAHFKTDKPEINEYLYCYLKDFNYQTMGSTSSIATAVNSKIIKAMPFVVPTDAELVTFHSATAPMFEMIKTRQRENTRLAELRDSLLPKLMSGEVDVSAVQL